MPYSQNLVLCRAKVDAYVQPDMSGSWPARPNGLIVAVPAWAHRLDLTLASSGQSGASGRRGAAGTAASGGGGGGAGTVMRYSVPLRNADGSLIASTATLTVGAPIAPGAAVTADSTNGASPASGQQTSTLVIGGLTCAIRGASTVPGGGSTANATGGSGVPSFMVPSIPFGGNSNIAGNGTDIFPSLILTGGTAGGSMSAADVAYNPGTVKPHNLTGWAQLSVDLTAGGNGDYALLGDLLIGRPGMGGAAGAAAAGQAGGNGGPGCGGGGGGASRNGFASGAGGYGGFGFAILNWTA